MSKLHEVAGQLQAVNDRLLKAKVEIIDRINALEDALGDAYLPIEAEVELAALMATAQAMDDINPDDELSPVEHQDE